MAGGATGADDRAAASRGRDDPAALDRFRAYRRSHDQALRAALVEEYAWIGNAAARRFVRRGESLDDLAQVAAFGVVKAVDRFDPEFGSSFSSFAFPTVIGEL